MAFIYWLWCSLAIGMCCAASDYTALVVDVSDNRLPVIVMNNRAMDATSAYKKVMSTTKCMCRQACRVDPSCRGYSRYPNGSCLFTNKTSLRFLASSEQNKKYNNTWGDSIYLVDAVYEFDVPSTINVGLDGLLYFKTEITKLSCCNATCNSFYGFRLAKASNALTMSQFRLWQYTRTFVDLILKKTLYKQYISSSCTSTGPGCADYIYWSDGTKLDRSFMSGEPITNYIGDWGDSFVMWNQGGILHFDYTFSTDSYPCLCQGNFIETNG